MVETKLNTEYSNHVCIMHNDEHLFIFFFACTCILQPYAISMNMWFFLFICFDI